MALDWKRAFHTGYESLASDAGMNVLGALALFNILYSTVVQSFQQQFAEFIDTGGTSPWSQGYTAPPPIDWDPLMLEFPVSLLGAMALAGLVTSEGIRFWAIRLFAGRSETAEAPKERLPAFLYLGVGFALVLFSLRTVLPVVGLQRGFNPVLLISQIGGLVGYLLLGVGVYLRQEIALNDGGVAGTVRNAIAGFREAPLRILGVLLLLGALGFVASLPHTYAYMLRGLLVTAGLPAVQTAQLVGIVLGSAVEAYGIATVTAAYRQLRVSE